MNAIGAGKARQTKAAKTTNLRPADTFTPCSPDMTLCGDCEDNRAKKKCPRLKEWVAKRER